MHRHDRGVCARVCVEDPDAHQQSTQLNRTRKNLISIFTIRLGDQCSTEMLISVCICAMQVLARVAPRMVLNRHFVAKNTSTSCQFFSGAGDTAILGKSNM